ncbi:uncharacterized protein LOC143029672 [Oratosquilla oratoria]|uniref:uncharacterized protein LOC143029672 n=1 Tax=Oratosquilla oratoria TaxID=337810 RepID=UPI003F76FC28
MQGQPPAHLFVAIVAIGMFLRSVPGVQGVDDFQPSYGFDHLVVPVSTLLGHPSDFALPGGAVLTPVLPEEASETAPVDKRAFRRFRTTTSSEYQMCNPSRGEVIKFLLALQEAKKGQNYNRLIQLCNRKSSAGAIDTNIRFLG